MATYIMLTNVTEQGIRTIKELPQRLRENEQRAGQTGVKLVGWYLTLGEYDAVGILEGPDDETVARALLGLGMQGNVRTTTLRAFNRTEAERIIQGLP